MATRLRVSISWVGFISGNLSIQLDTQLYRRVWCSSNNASAISSLRFTQVQLSSYAIGLTFHYIISFHCLLCSMTAPIQHIITRDLLILTTKKPSCLPFFYRCGDLFAITVWRHWPIVWHSYALLWHNLETSSLWSQIFIVCFDR